MTTVEELELRVRALEARLGGQPQRPQRPATPGGDAADVELDREYGNPEVRKDPPRWTGQSYAGSRMSDCAPDYLDAVASLKDWVAQRQEEAGEVDAKGRPRADWSRKDARLARGWARRLRSGWTAGPAVAPSDAFSDDAPF